MKSLCHFYTMKCGIEVHVYAFIAKYHLLWCLSENKMFKGINQIKNCIHIYIFFNYICMFVYYVFIGICKMLHLL